MTTSNLSEALKEAYASAPSDALILHTLEFRHPSFVDEGGSPTSIFVVRDNVDLDATIELDDDLYPGVTVRFIGYAFDFQLPEVSESAAPELTITIDNVNRLIDENLERAILSPSKIEVIYRPYLASDLSAPQMNPPLRMTIMSVETGDLTVTARAGFGDIANKIFPSLEYTPSEFPGLVR